MVSLILAFIFLTPRAWFRDQPRAATITMLQAHDDVRVLFIARELLAGVPEQEQRGEATRLLQKRFGRKIELLRLEPISNEESEIQGYMALVKP